MVSLGIRLRQLSRHRVALAVSFALACLAALNAAYGVSLIPPALGTKNPSTAVGAHTQVLVDDVKVSSLDSGFDMNSLNYLHEGTMLAGTLMVQDPSTGYIAQLAHVPITDIAFTDPQTAAQSELSAHQPPPKYTLTVAARTTAPILDVYATAPTLAGAKNLLDASVQGLSKTIAGKGNFGLRVRQLGSGAEVDTGGGGNVKAALEAFLLVFVVSCLMSLLVVRVRRDWPRARQATRAAS